MVILDKIIQNIAKDEKLTKENYRSHNSMGKIVFHSFFIQAKGVIPEILNSTLEENESANQGI